MSEKIKYIISQLNKSPYNQNYNLISFDSISPLELLQVLYDVLSEIDSNEKNNTSAIDMDDPEEKTIRLLSMLRVLRYNPSTDAVLFRQGLVQGEKHIIHPILEWLLRNSEDLKKRAYLAHFLVKVEIPVEMLGDSDISQLYEHYEQLIEDFKTAHKELTALKARGLSAQELRSDIDAMEKEKQIVAKKIERASRKLENMENKEGVLETARQLRLERERQKELSQQRANELELMQELQQTSAQLTQQLSDLRQASLGTTPEGLVRSLEEEVKMTRYIATEKLPKEIEAKRKEIEIMSRVANSLPPNQAMIDSLRQQIEAVSQEVSDLAQKGLAAKEGNEDKLVPYRQQAQIMARRKEEAAEAFGEAKARLEALQEELAEKNRGTNSDQVPSGPLLTEKQYKEYLSQLKVRSTLYKAKKAQISALVSESGVLARTIDILNQYHNSIPAVDSYEGMSEKELEGIPRDEILQQINIINNQINSHKAAITPKLQELRETREKYNELLEEYTDKKRTHDSKAALLETSIAKLEHEVKEMEKEEHNDQSAIALLDAKTDILKALLERAEKEGKSREGDKAPFRTKLELKVNEAERLNTLLKEEQNSVRAMTEKKAKQRDLWMNLELLLKCKEECIEAARQKGGVVKRGKGTETLVLE